MKHSKKILALVLSVAVVASIAAAGTLAWLTADGGTVTNTFNVGTQGQVAIVLDEADNTKTDGSRTTTGNTYDDVLPGATLAKDPTVHVSANSADCYVYAKVENGMADVADVTISSDWTPIAEGSNIYRYKEVVASSESVTDLPALFTVVNVHTDLTAETLASQLDGKTIVVSAFAIQADNLGENALAVADEAANGFFNPAA